MRLNNIFIKLKLPNRVKEIYSTESKKRVNINSNLIDQEIHKYYQNVVEKNFTIDWCNNVQNLVKVIEKTDASIVKKVSRIKEYNIMKSMCATVRDSLNFISKINIMIDKYSDLSTLYIDCYEKYELDCYKKLKSNIKDLDKLKSFLNDMSQSKENLNSQIIKYIDKSNLDKYNHLETLEKDINHIFLNVDSAFKGIEIGEKINKECYNLLEKAKKLHQEFDINPTEFCSKKNCNINRKTPEDLQNELSLIEKQITLENERFIDNYSDFKQLIYELQYLQEVKMAEEYYNFIKKYQFGNSKYDNDHTFSILDESLNNTNNKKFKYLNFPFNSEWKKVQDYFRKYYKKERMKEKIEKIFDVIVENPQYIVILTSAIMLFLTIMSWKNINKFATHSIASLIIVSITVLVVSSICIVGGFKIHYDFEHNPLSAILNIIYPLLPCIMLFFNKSLDLNIVMQLFSATVLIITSICFLNYSNCIPFYIYLIGHLFAFVVILVFHSIMRNYCNALVMYILFYICIFLAEVCGIFYIGFFIENDFDELVFTLLFLIGEIIMALAFLFFALAAITRSYLWGAIPGVIIGLGMVLSLVAIYFMEAFY